jgi:hypothetical protein
VVLFWGGGTSVVFFTEGTSFCLMSITVCCLKGNCEAVHVIKTCGGVEVDVRIFLVSAIFGGGGLILYPGHFTHWVGTSVGCSVSMNAAVNRGMSIGYQT